MERVSYTNMSINNTNGPYTDNAILFKIEPCRFKVCNHVSAGVNVLGELDLFKGRQICPGDGCKRFIFQTVLKPSIT